MEKIFVIVEAKHLFKVTSEVIVEDVDVLWFHKGLENILIEMLPELQLYLQVNLGELLDDLQKGFFSNCKPFHRWVSFVNKRESFPVTYLKASDSCARPK